MRLAADYLFHKKFVAHGPSWVVMETVVGVALTCSNQTAFNVKSKLCTLQRALCLHEQTKAGEGGPENVRIQPKLIS